MTGQADDRDELSEITDDFLRRLKAGENPDIEQYARQYPALANKLRMFLPMFKEMRSPQPSDSSVDDLSDGPLRESASADEIADPSRRHHSENGSPAPKGPPDSAGTRVPVEPPRSTTRPVAMESAAATASRISTDRAKCFVVGGVTGAAIVLAIVGAIAMSDSKSPQSPPPPPPPVAFSDSAGHRFMQIPAGRFPMGTDAAEIRRLAGNPKNAKRGDELRSELPLHEVQIRRRFYLGESEVTVKEFREFVEATKYKTDAERDGTGRGWNVKQGEFETGPQYTWRSPGWEQADDLPVVLVSWFDAGHFCEWKTKVENERYRLPTEAEWEYVRAKDTQPVFDEGVDPETANIADLSLRTKHPGLPVEVVRDRHVFTAPVASFHRNHYGLYHLTGNVREWCSDWYAADYSGAVAIDPQGPPAGVLRVRRGGSWYRSGLDLRLTSRAGPLEPAQANAETGFRVVREIIE